MAVGMKGDGTETGETNRDAMQTGKENLDKKNLDAIKAVENHRAGTKTAGTKAAETRVVGTRIELRTDIMIQIDRITHHDTIMEIGLVIDPMAGVDLTEVQSEIKIDLIGEIDP